MALKPQIYDEEPGRSRANATQCNGHNRCTYGSVGLIQQAHSFEGVLMAHLDNFALSSRVLSRSPEPSNPLQE